MASFALVAIGYNRSKSMERLLYSLAMADYENDKVDLIISIDNSGTADVEKSANEFAWKHGIKRVITYPERQGLRKHILHCGEFVRDYDAIAVFEDDVVAAPGFYHYMKATVEKYKDNDRVAGISLYNHLWNVNVNLPFLPAYSQYDSYFLQFAQSWGQVWMKRQWLEFAKWYAAHSEEFGANANIPSFVSGWPKTSWLKYHIKYCIETDKYFVYPYCSLTTCYSDVGEHCIEKDNHLQVPMLQGTKKNYYLPQFGCRDAVYYDAFFERVLSGQYGEFVYENVCMDLYGSRTSYQDKRYILSSKSFPYAIIKSYALELRPHEMNVINAIPGNDIFLYDSYKQEAPTKKQSHNQYIQYYFRLYGNGKSFTQYIILKIVNKIRKRIKK